VKKLLNKEIVNLTIVKRRSVIKNFTALGIGSSVPTYLSSIDVTRHSITSDNSLLSETEALLHSLTELTSSVSSLHPEELQFVLFHNQYLETTDFQSQIRNRSTHESQEIRSFAENYLNWVSNISNYYSFSSRESFESQLSSVYDYKDTHFNDVVSIMDNISSFFNILLSTENIVEAKGTKSLLKSMLITLQSLYTVCHSITNTNGSLSNLQKRDFYRSLILTLSESVLIKYPLNYQFEIQDNRDQYNIFLVRLRSILGTDELVMFMTVYNWFVERSYTTPPLSSTLNTLRYLLIEGTTVVSNINDRFESLPEELQLTRLNHTQELLTEPVKDAIPTLKEAFIESTSYLYTEGSYSQTEFRKDLAHLQIQADMNMDLLRSISSHYGISLTEL
jgi:hypothetical protein